jgi:hypothetical protein
MTSKANCNPNTKCDHHREVLAAYSLRWANEMNDTHVDAVRCFSANALRSLDRMKHEQINDFSKTFP